MQSEAIIRPMGFTRRMARPSPGGAAILTGSGFDRVLSDLASDPFVQIAGRDGSTSLATPGTTFLDVPTGAPISANRAWNMIGPGGLVLPMYTAFPAIVNLCTSQAGTSGGLASNTLTGLSRNIVESATVAQHYAITSAFSLTDGASYRLRYIASRSSGSRHACVYVGRSGFSTAITLDLDTGTAAGVASGAGAAVSNVSSTSLGGGRWLVYGDITCSAWGGTVQVISSIRNTSGASILPSYSGDGTSGIAYEAVTLSAGTQTVLGVAEGATRAADANIWTMADALTQDEEIIVLSAQCYASGDMGVTSQTWLASSAGGSGSNPSMTRGGATTLNVNDYNGTTVVTDTLTRTIPAKGIVFMQRAKRKPTSIEAGFNQSTSGSPEAQTGTLNPSTAFKIGGSGVAGRDSYALNACLRRKGGFTQAQIDALYFGFANGRTVPVAA